MSVNKKLENSPKESIMLKDLVIHFIFADDCPDCEAMRSTLRDAIAHSSYDKERCHIVEISCEKDEAVDIALEYDIDDLPACIIGRFSFCGKNKYTYEAILDAIEKTWEDDSGEVNYETACCVY